MKKGFSIKLRILSFTVLPATVITIALLFSGIKLIKSGMEQEILKGLMSSAYTYKDIGVNVTYREAGDNEIESNLKKDTGYDFTWFDGDTIVSRAFLRDADGKPTIVFIYLDDHDPYSDDGVTVYTDF